MAGDQSPCPHSVSEAELLCRLVIKVISVGLWQLTAAVRSEERLESGHTRSHTQHQHLYAHSKLEVTEAVFGLQFLIASLPKHVANLNR